MGVQQTQVSAYKTVETHRALWKCTRASKHNTLEKGQLLTQCSCRHKTHHQQSSVGLSAVLLIIRQASPAGSRLRGALLMRQCHTRRKQGYSNASCWGILVIVTAACWRVFGVHNAQPGPSMLVLAGAGHTQTVIVNPPPQPQDAPARTVHVSRVA